MKEDDSEGIKYLFFANMMRSSHVFFTDMMKSSQEQNKKRDSLEEIKIGNNEDPNRELNPDEYKNSLVQLVIYIV